MITLEQKNLVQTSFKKVVPISELAATLFYNRLFTLDPDLRFLFTGDIDEQGRKLMQMLSLAVHSLDKLDVLVPAVQRLGERHAKYGVRASDYATVAQALLWTLEQGLGSEFTRPVREAWIAVYSLLADTMLEAGSRLTEAPTMEIAYSR